MSRRTLTLALVAVITVCATIAVAPVCNASAASVTSLSKPGARVGARLTILGAGFSTRQGDSTVTFGERRNALGFAPCSKRAKVLSWTRSSITVRVPGMAPGSHKVYVTVDGRMSNSYPFSIDPATVISGKEFSTSAAHGNVISGQHDVLYDDCTFTATNPDIAGDLYGVLTIAGPARNLTFRNCTFIGNFGPGSDGTGVNGVKITDNTGQLVHDITFDNCRFGAFSRMGIETVEAGTWGAAGYRPGITNIAILDSVFEPPGAEPISFNFWQRPDFIHNCLVSGCTFKGFGNKANANWGAGFECSGQGVEVRNSEFWAGNGFAVFNIAGRGTGKRSYLLFRNVTVDCTRTYQEMPIPYGERIFGFSNLSYTRWRDCTFNTGTMELHCFNAGSAESGQGWVTCTHNDFSGSTIAGCTKDWAIGGETYRPKTGADYWDDEANRTNNWPRIVR